MDTERSSSNQIRPEDEAGRVQRDRAVGERERVVDNREAALDKRENRAAVHEAGVDARVELASEVMAEAERRDDKADVRDRAADEREHAASLDAFVHPDDQYDAAIKARRSSANDRSDSKSDRASSAKDRSTLSDS